MNATANSLLIEVEDGALSIRAPWILYKEKGQEPGRRVLNCRIDEGFQRAYDHQGCWWLGCKLANAAIGHHVRTGSDLCPPILSFEGRSEVLRSLDQALTAAGLDDRDIGTCMISFAHGMRDAIAGRFYIANWFGSLNALCCGAVLVDPADPTRTAQERGQGLGQLILNNALEPFVHHPVDIDIDVRREPGSPISRGDGSEVKAMFAGELELMIELPEVFIMWGVRGNHYWFHHFMQQNPHYVDSSFTLSMAVEYMKSMLIGAGLTPPKVPTTPPEWWIKWPENVKRM